MAMTSSTTVNPLERSHELSLSEISCLGCNHRSRHTARVAGPGHLMLTVQALVTHPKGTTVVVHGEGHIARLSGRLAAGIDSAVSRAPVVTPLAGFMIKSSSSFQFALQDAGGPSHEVGTPGRVPSRGLHGHKRHDTDGSEEKRDEDLDDGDPPVTACCT